jgi:hypothetical protein
VLLRLCVRDNAELGGVLIRKGTPVFVAFAAALYAALYRGPLLQSIPSAVPTATGVYLANLSLGGRRGQGGVVRLRWPAQLSPSGEITRSIDEHDRGTAVHADRPGPP